MATPSSKWRLDLATDLHSALDRARQDIHEVSASTYGAVSRSTLKALLDLSALPSPNGTTIRDLEALAEVLNLDLRIRLLPKTGGTPNA